MNKYLRVAYLLIFLIGTVGFSLIQDTDAQDERRRTAVAACDMYDGGVKLDCIDKAYDTDYANTRDDVYEWLSVACFLGLIIFGVSVRSD